MADQSTLMLGCQTTHGRSTPLIWMTVRKSELKGQRNEHEDNLLAAFRKLVPENVRVTVIADRGFSDTKLYSFLNRMVLSSDFVLLRWRWR